MANEDAGTIEIQVKEIAQLFDMLDPYPFRDRDIDKDAEEFIVSWAREFPRDTPLRLLVHAPKSQTESPAAQELAKAVASHFRHLAEGTARDLRELFRIGRLALLIGLIVLAICVAAGRLAVRAMGETELSSFISEGLLLLGWVSNWRPIEIFLYEWWPIARKCALYRRIAAAKVEFAPH